MMGAAEARSGVRLEAAAAIVAAALASAFPPEAYPEAGALACVLAALAALRLGSSFVAVGVALSALAFNAAVSLAPLRTLAVAAGALPLVAVFLCARRFAPRERRALAWSLVGVGAAQAALGVAQRLFLLRRMAAAAAAAGAPADVVARLADQRPFGTETLPAALGGLLVLALAACGLLWRGASRKWLVAAAAVLLASALALTGSFGALLGGAAGLLALLAFSTLRRRRAAWIVALVAVAALFAGVLAARPMHDLGLSNPRNPLRLRAGNWRGAVVAARERPVTGLGLGGFGAVYPNVARPGDLPTVYAHNAWLQLAVEGGLPAAAALAAGAWWAWRRRRALADQERRFAAAAVVAFVAHNLFDFTLFLPGVSWAAAALAGIAFGDDGPTVEPRETASSSSPDDAWNAKARRVVRVAAVGGLAALIAAGGAWYALEARARRALDRADAAFVAGDAAGAARDALTAARSPLASPALQLDAGRLLLAAAPKAGGTAAAAAADVAARLKRFDPYSPAGFHLAADVELASGKPGPALVDLRLAAARHPADGALAAQASALESSLAAAGLGSRPLEYGGVPTPATNEDWELWDLLLLGLQALLAATLVQRWFRPGAASATMLALAFVLLAVVWGEGGALPGARLGRQILVVVGLLALLWPRRAPDEERPEVSLPLLPIVALLPAVLWAALATLAAPDLGMARDGLLGLVGALTVLVLSWQVARGDDSWTQVVLWVFVASAALAGALWMVQRGAILLGFDLANAEVPLRADPLRPAGDFLHPGHIGTYLVAAGLAVGGYALGEDRKWRFRWGLAAGALCVVGLLGAARASLLALAAGGLVLAFVAARGRQRLVVGGLVGLGLAAGGGALAWRFMNGVPFPYSRVGIWRAALAAIGDRPIFGVGPGGFPAVARGYAFRDPQGPAEYAKQFLGPHSDLLAPFVDLGVVGGILLLAGLAWCVARAARAVRSRGEDWGAEAGALAALAAFGAHALVDDLFAARPAVAIASAALLGALGGRAGARALRLGVASRCVVAVAAVVALLAGEAAPWGADFAQRGGRPDLAAALDPARVVAHIAVARGASGPAQRRLAAAAEGIERAGEAARGGTAFLEERATFEDALCRGPLAERSTCAAARAAWDAAIAARPTSAPLRRGRGRLAASLGDAAAAERDVRAALDLEPNYLGARLDLLRLLAEGGKIEEARAQFAELARRARQWDGYKPASPLEATLLRLEPDELQRLRSLKLN